MDTFSFDAQASSKATTSEKNNEIIVNQTTMLLIWESREPQRAVQKSFDVSCIQIQRPSGSHAMPPRNRWLQSWWVAASPLRRANCAMKSLREHPPGTCLPI